MTDIIHYKNLAQLIVIASFFYLYYTEIKIWQISFNQIENNRKIIFEKFK